MSEGVNGDISVRAMVRTAEAAWRPSPVRGVWRKRLEHTGSEEGGRATSLVRFDPGASFPAHDHPDGEEILVLDGLLCDEHGEYPKGAFLLNPEGFRHAPHSREGCVLFVKLRQYPGANRHRVVVDTERIDWLEEGEAGRAVKQLYDENGYPENIRLTRLGAGTRIDRHDHPGGNEMLVLEGSIEDEYGPALPGDWIRQPAASVHTPWTEDGVVLYVKDGHLRPGAAFVPRPRYHG